MDSPSRSDSASSAPPRILVVEDESIVARDICQQLSQLGMIVVGSTRTAEEALEMVGQLQPDLVMMDVQLAGEMDGITAAQLIKERFDLPVVFLTAFAGSETTERALAADPFGYIVKPFNERDLRTTVNIALFKHRTESQLRAITNGSQDAIIMIDGEGKVTFWNPAAESIFGYRAEEMIGREVHTVLALPPEQQSFRRAFPQFQRTGHGAAIGHTVELPARRKDGARIEISLSLSAVKQGHRWQALAILRDITARKRADTQIRLQGAALEASESAVIITDTRGKIEYVNPSFCRVTGYTREEVIGQNPRILKSGQHDAAFYAEMWRTISSGRNWQGEIINLRKDGTPFTESVNIAPVRDAKGTITHYISSNHDISVLKQNMADLQMAHRELEQKNQALDKALVEAQAAAVAKTAFLAMMSHELRTPMNGVIGMASLLRETEPLTAEQRDFIEIINSSGNTLLSLINDVLDFSKIEAQQLELDPAPFDVRRCLEETMEVVAVRAREKHLELALEIAPGVPPAVIGDALRLRQVLVNLLGNAVKFTAKGEVVLEVRARPVLASHMQLVFRVRDTGIGIPADKMGLMFKPFSQLDNSTTRHFGGTGLGLSISERLVKLMGGQIEVESTPGQGSVFSFTIDVEATAALTPLDPTRYEAELRGRIILVVDDNETNRRIFTTHLQQAGSRIVLAESAAEALAWLAQNEWPDLIITDMLMPDTDGLDFALQVRAMEQERQITPEIPLIMVSSGGYQHSDPRVPTANLTAALSKPVRRLQLYETVVRACLGRELRHPVDPPAEEVSPLLALSHPRSILVVEDNPVNLKLAYTMLTRLGYAVDTAADGHAAVAACQKLDYDLVFMDVQLPGIDGLEAARQIRTLSGRQPWIIAMTANALNGDREICLEAGMNDYLPKPMRLDDLRRAIRQSPGLKSQAT